MGRAGALRCERRQLGRPVGVPRHALSGAGAGSPGRSLPPLSRRARAGPSFGAAPARQIRYSYGCRERRRHLRSARLAGGAVRRRLRSGRASCFSTISGVENEPLYTPETAPSTTSATSATRARIPFTRGVYPSMYRGRLWTMRQFAGFGTAEETNERFRYLLDHGQTGLSTAFDMPTLMGYDSDHPRSLGEVGREGVAIDSLDDMETLFAGIPLGEVSTSMTINSPAAILLAFYVCVGEEQGVARERAARDGPDGHPQGVHRAEGVHLPAGAVDAARHRHGRVVRARDAAVAPDLDLRLPHPRGRLDRRAGARVHARGRVRLRRVRRSSAGSTSTTSRRGSRSSSTRTSTSSRRSRSTARRGGSGRASCASATARRTRGRC